MTPERPFFSVVIPTYNCAARLRETVRSVLAQTDGDYEVLIADDGSTDETSDVVRSFEDSRIRYTWAANSGGPAAPRNRGIAAATGDWICFLDADDVWLPAKLATIREAISARPDVDVIGHDEWLVRRGETDRSRLRHGPSAPDFYRVMLIEGNRCSTSAMTVRRSYVRRHELRFNESPDYVIVEDYDFWLQLARAGAKFDFLSVVLGEYRLTDSSISLNTERVYRNEETLLRDHVFKLQTFETDKTRLWRAIALRLKAKRVRVELRNGSVGGAARIGVEMLLDLPHADPRYLWPMVKRVFGRSSI